jgi:hypothetical protein
MDALNEVAPIHFYDTGVHQILCGLRGYEHRSTKHARGVTCHACVRLLGERDAAGRHATAPAGEPVHG